MNDNKKINYQLLCDDTIKEVISNKKRPRLLLHSCCAPCSSYVLEYLSKYFDITVYYYNPNIDSDKEYNFRSSEQKRLIELMGLDVKFVSEDFSPSDFFEAVKGLEHYKEGGPRCKACFELRLNKAASYAKNNNYDFFTTTLSISPLKNAKVLNDIGLILQEKYGVRFLQADFKKKNGYLRSVELSKKFNIYRQDYCGCIFSKQERELAKNKGNTSIV